MAAIAIVIALHSFGNDAFLKSFEKSPAQGLAITYPLNGTIFPPELVAPTFRWNDARTIDNTWVVGVAFDNLKRQMRFRVHAPQWRPDRRVWETIKKLSAGRVGRITIIGFRQGLGHGLGAKNVCGDKIRLPRRRTASMILCSTATLFCPSAKRSRTLRACAGGSAPFPADAEPPVVLEKLPVCGNCHSFSADGKTLAMDVDYANDKGAYAVTGIARAR